MKKTSSLFAIITIMAVILCTSGCKKDAVSTFKSPVTAAQAANSASTIPDSMIMTPYGLMLKSTVHLIEPGYKLEVKDGHVLKIKANTGERIADFGDIQPKTVSGSSGQQNLRFRNLNSSQAPSGNGWATYAEWGAPTGTPINLFSTTWTVPGNPTTNHGQLIYIWNGLEPYEVRTNNPNGLVIQPVLQWGANGTGTNTFGGQYWTISNWCAWNGGGAYTTPQTNIPAGTNLTGVLTYTSMQPNGSYNYTSAFTGYTNTMNVTQGNIYNNLGAGSVSLPLIPVESWAYEVLEVFNVSTATDYPAQLSVNMRNITVKTGAPGANNPAAMTWLPLITSGVATLGEHTNVISSNSSGGGEVDLYFHVQPPVIYYNTPNVFAKGAAITALNPANTGGAAASYSVSPALPAGLTINTNTGVISGTPTTVTAAANYTVTATNSSGSGNFVVNIAIAQQPLINGTTGLYPTSGSLSGNITAGAGTLVHVGLSAYGPGTLLKFTLNGPTLSGSVANTVQISNGPANPVPTFTMPVSGSVTWTATVQAAPSGNYSIYVY